MSEPDELLDDSAEELFEHAPCGYLTTDLDGHLLRVNQTFEEMTGYGRAELLSKKTFQDLLAPGARIYHDTHYAPLLMMQGAVREIAVEIVRADGSRLPALINSTLRRNADGKPGAIRTMVFDATARRRYETELLENRKREHEIAQRLQRSMLAGEMPEATGLELDVVYRPGVEGLEVGGDWYDAFWLDDEQRSLGLVVGDVVGRGIEAAATMGQLRSAVRALAGTGRSPAALLEDLDAYSRRHDVGRMVTLIYAQLVIATGELRYACAGHPPPLLVPSHAPARFAWEGRSLPLDAHGMDPLPRGEAVEILEPDTALILYTDGLVETRMRPINDGLEALRDSAEKHRDSPAKFIAETLVADADGGDHADDVCLMIVRLAPRAAG